MRMGRCSLGLQTEGEMATVEGSFMDGLFRALIEIDEDAVCSVLSATFGSVDAVEVHLICGDLPAPDALAYARVLAELGQELVARELLTEVVRSIGTPAPTRIAA